MGIVKPSIFSGLEKFTGFPGGFGLDLLHLVTLNLTDLVLSLLRGTLVCDDTNTKDSWDFVIFMDKKAWKKHGEIVASCGRFLPGSFDRVPCNPTEKILLAAVRLRAITMAYVELCEV